MRKMKKAQILFISFWIFAIPIALLATERGGIQGKVVDAKTGRPLPSVNIIVKGTTFGAATDMNGKFYISNVPIGIHKVMASMIGYKIAIKRIKVSTNRTIKLDFRLIETQLEMGTVVVTATRTPRYIKDVPVRMEVITSRGIEEKNATNLYEALRGLPGIRVEQQCQYCNFSIVRLQGLGPDHTQVLIDGQPVYSGLASVYGLQQLGTADIDRIEVMKGSGSALYGSGVVAGAINIITKKPSQIPKAKVDLEYGSYNTHNYIFTASAKRDNIGLSLTAQKHGGDAIDQTRDGYGRSEVRKPDGISDRVKTEATNMGFKMTIDTLLGSDNLTLAGRTVYENRQGGVLTGYTYENPFTESTERIITNRYELELGYKKEFIYGNEINFTFANTLHNRNATNDAALCDYRATHHDSLPPLDEMRPYLARENTYSLNINYLHPLFKSHRLLLGFQYSHNRLNETGKYVVVDRGDPNYGILYTSKSEKYANEAGAYLQDEFSIADLWEFVIGVRYDYHKSRDNFRGSGKVAPEGVPPVKYNEKAVNPRLAAKYALTSSLTLRGSIGTGFRVPYGFSEDLHLCSGSPRVWKGADLKPEKSISYNLSLDYEMEKISLSANLFHTNLKNKIGFVEAGKTAKSLGYTYEWKNIDNAYVRGVELDANFLLLQNLSLSANLTFNDGQYKHERADWIATNYQKESKYISRFPRNTAGFKLKFIHKSMDFVFDGDYQGTMYIDYYRDEEEPTKIKKTEPHLILNTKISLRLSNEFKVYLGVRNLSDYIQLEKHTDDAAFMYAPVYGRIFYSGIKIGF